jgi:DNA primase
MFGPEALDGWASQMMDAETVRTRLDLQRFYQGHVGKLKINGNQQAIGLCPFHDDHVASFSVSLKTGLYKCFACDAKGDLFSFYQRVKGIDFPSAVLELGARAGLIADRPIRQQVVARFDYHDSTSKLLYSKERLEPGRDGRKKEFRFFHHDSSGMRQSGRGTEPVLYQLPNVLGARALIIVEGEAKADLLTRWGLVATCLDTGAQSKLTEEMIGQLSRKRIGIVPDNDEPGREYATRVAQALYGKVETLRIVKLPGLPDRGDILDWVKYAK